MPGAVRLKAFGRAQLPHWEYLGGERIDLDTDDKVAATLPNNCTIVEIRARGQALYYILNDANPSQAAPGYIPADGGEILGPLSNLNDLWFYSAADGAYAHVMYFREV